MEEAVASKNRIREILDFIDIGILTFDKSLLIDENYSKFLEFFYEEDQVADSDIFSYIFPNHDISKDNFSKMKNSAIALFDDDIISWDMNKDNFVNEAIININGKAKVIDIHWTPIVNIKTETISKLMVSITDVTHEKDLEIEIQKEKNLKEKTVVTISKIISQPREQIKNFVKKALHRLGNIEKQCKLIEDEGISNLIFIEIHTIKGEARSFGFDEIAEAAHN